MIEKPGVPDAVILQALEACYAIRATRMEFVPRGLDPNGWAYRVEAGAQAYFVKVSKGRVDEGGAWAPMFLARKGFSEVIAPLPTRSGDVLGWADDLTLRVQPFVAGECAMEAGMTHQMWEHLGGFLGRLHNLELPTAAKNRIRREAFAARRMEWVQDMQRHADSDVDEDAISAELASFWREQRTTIASLIERTIEVRRAARREAWPMVLCHGDVHSGNLLLGHDGRLYVIDWDDVILAPRERDLMFVLAELPAAEERDFFAAYGAAEINPVILAYYRHDWCIEDIGAFGREIQDKYAGEETRLNSLCWFRGLFGPGGSVPAALAEVVSDSGT